MTDKSTTLITPKGFAVFPSLDRKDMKFAAGDELRGQYKADVAISAEDAKPLIKQLQDIYKDWTGKAAKASGNTMFEPEVDRESGEETGRIIFKCRVKDKELKNGDIWDRKPKVFDGSGNLVKEVPAIGGGSIIKVQVEVYQWQTPDGKKGVSLQPKSVQLISLQERLGGVSNPFDEEPDADFSADDVDEDSPFEVEEQQDVPDSANF